jgi:hypothetical protein
MKPMQPTAHLIRLIGRLLFLSFCLAIGIAIAVSLGASILWMVVPVVACLSVLFFLSQMVVQLSYLSKPTALIKIELKELKMREKRFNENQLTDHLQAYAQENKQALSFERIAAYLERAIILYGKVLGLEKEFGKNYQALRKRFIGVLRDSSYELCRTYYSRAERATADYFPTSMVNSLAYYLEMLVIDSNIDFKKLIKLEAKVPSTIKLPDMESLRGELLLVENLWTEIKKSKSQSGWFYKENIIQVVDRFFRDHWKKFKPPAAELYLAKLNDYFMQLARDSYYLGKLLCYKKELGYTESSTDQSRSIGRAFFEQLCTQLEAWVISTTTRRTPMARRLKDEKDFRNVDPIAIGIPIDPQLNPERSLILIDASSQSQGKEQDVSVEAFIDFANQLYSSVVVELEHADEKDWPVILNRALTQLKERFHKVALACHPDKKFDKPEESTALFQAINAIQAETKQSLEELIDNASSFKALNDLIQELAKAIQRNGEELELLRQQFKAYEETINRYEKNVELLSLAVATHVKLVDEYQQSVIDLDIAVKEYGKNADEYIKNTNELIKSNTEYIKNADELLKKADEHLKKTDEHLKKTDQFEENVSNFHEYMRQELTALRERTDILMQEVLLNPNSREDADPVLPLSPGENN